MSDIGPYGVTQHADAQMVTANELVGEHAGNVTEHQTDARFARATFSTAPYKRHREGKCRGKDDTCGAPPMRGTDLCWFHSPVEEEDEPASPA